MSTRTGIHCGYELKHCRVLCLNSSARYGDDSRFQWLAQSFQRRPRKLGQFVKKENAMMGETDFARSRAGAAAYQGRPRRCVMRRSERAATIAAFIETQGTYGCYRGNFECFNRR